MKRMMNRKETKEMKDMRNENHGRNEKHSGIRRGGIIAMAIALTLTLAATSVSYAWGGRNEFGGQRGGQTQNGQMGGWGMMASSASTANLAEVSEEDLVTVESISTDVFSKRDLEQTADTEDAETITVTDGGSVTLTKAGVYVFTGTASEYTITVEASKEDKVQIVLDSVTITNSDWPVIYVVSADKVFVTLAEGESSLSVTGSFREDGDENPDAVIYSKDDLTLNGTGTLNVTSAAGHGIVCKDDLKITGGTWNVVAGKHAFKANDSISICGGTFTIKAGKDGFHCGKSDGTKGSIYISDGSFTIHVDDVVLWSAENPCLYTLVLRYAGELAESAGAVKRYSPALTTIAQEKLLCALSVKAGLLSERIDALQEAIVQGNQGPDAYSLAVYRRDVLLPAMHAVREVADELETMVDEERWPFPTYSALLFQI